MGGLQCGLFNRDDQGGYAGVGRGRALARRVACFPILRRKPEGSPRLVEYLFLGMP